MNQISEYYRDKLIRNATSQELLMRRILDELNIRYEFQKVIDFPPTFLIADFYLPYPYRCVIEVDGTQHERSITVKCRDEDKERYLKELGISTIRIGNRVLTESNFKSIKKYMYKILSRVVIRQSSL